MECVDMAVIQKNDISQMENGSPAQIWDEAPDLAGLVFSSNSELLIWAKKFEVLNCNSADSEEIAAIVDAHAHTHAHAHAEQ